MTNGSSQGLFVVVSVVIFGIFVAISYTLFRDQLTPSLASIFSDSTKQSEQNSTPFEDLGSTVDFFSTSTYDEYSKTYTIKPNVDNIWNTSDLQPSGLQFNDVKEIPWGYKIIVEYDILYSHEKDLIAPVDFNAFVEDNNSWWGQSKNDNYGTTYKNIVNNSDSKKLNPNFWNKVSFWIVNDSDKNTNKIPLLTSLNISGNFGSVIGLQIKEIRENNIQEFKIRNIRYKIVKM